MKKNKYLMFISIGFELIALILFFIYLTEYLVKNQGWPESTKAFGVLLAMGLWMVSLFFKLKSANKNESND